MKFADVLVKFWKQKHKSKLAWMEMVQMFSLIPGVSKIWKIIWKLKVFFPNTHLKNKIDICKAEKNVNKMFRNILPAKAS